MLIYLRHADDDCPEATHCHDHRITERGAKKSRKVARRLIKKYGPPDIIYCSPFRRTRETLEAMWKEFPRHKPEVVIDCNLSRYFSPREQNDPNCYDETIKYGAPVYENWKDFRRRVRKHIHFVRRQGHFKDDNIVWCITHALVYKQVAQRYEVPIPEHIPFLDCFSLRRNPEYSK